MTELTDEAMTKLADDCVLAAKCMDETDAFPTGQAILREAARALLDARAERNALFRRATLAEEWRDHDKARAEKAEAELAAALSHNGRGE